MSNKLSCNDKTVKFDSFDSLFNYAFSKIDKFTKDDEFLLDALVNKYFSDIFKDKKEDPMELSNELNSVYTSLDKEYFKDINKVLIITFLMSKCNEYIVELFFSKLR